MNWTTILGLSRVRLADPNAKIWSDAELLRFANEVQRDVTIGSEANLKHFSFPLIDGTRRYDFPADFYELRGVRVNGAKVFGTHAYRLEDLDRDYLQQEGRPEWYYQEDLSGLSFYKVPSWTEDYDTIDSDLGVMVQWTDSDDATFSSEVGVVIGAIDDSQGKKFVFDGLLGVVIAEDNAAYVADIAYAYLPPDLVYGSDTPDLPSFMHYAVLYGVLREAFDREGQGQNQALGDYYRGRYDELKKEWFYRNREFSRGQDQFMSQKPVSWGDDLDYRLRVWP